MTPSDKTGQNSSAYYYSSIEKGMPMKSLGTILLVFIISFSAFTDDQSTELTILHMNDVHSHLLPYPYGEGQAAFGGIAKAAALIEELRLTNPNTLVLNAGDLLVGDFMYAATYDPPEAPVVGFADFFVMNMIKFDAFALGNHEFDLGPDMLYAVLSHESIQENLPPILCANIANIEEHPGLATIVRPDTILQRGDLSIGIIGFVTEETNLIAHPAPLIIDSLWDGDPAEPASLAPKDSYQTMINDLRNRGADIVIALTHVGDGGERLLAQLYEGIDIIIGGHSHDVTQTVLEGPHGNDIPYARAGAYTRYLAEMNVTIENNQVISHSYDLHEVFESILEDPEVTVAVQNFKDQVEEKWPGVYSDVVREIPFYMDGLGETDGDVDKKETNLGNLITDATRNKLETDVAIEAAGVIRQSLLESDATPADIYRVVSMGFRPDRNEVGYRLVIADVPALNLVGAIQFALGNLGSSFFFQVSGITFEYDSSLPPGERLDIESIRINGEPIDDLINDRYTIGINEYVAGFGLALGFVSEQDLTPTEHVQYEVVKAYIDTVDLAQYEELQGRIIDTADPVSVPVSGEIPTSIELKQNYPNPFNPVTTIRYTLDTRSYVTLEIYNVLGQKVTTLVNEEQPAGIYETQFDSGDTRGITLPSGVYVYRLQIKNDDVGMVSESRKMILMK